MRPDAVDWSRTTQMLGLAFMPRQRLHRVLTRWLIASVFAQAALTFLSLWFLRIISPSDLFRWPWSKPQLCIVASAVLTLMLVTLLARRSLRRWTAGVRMLLEAIRNFGTSSFIKPVPVVGEGEVAYLSMAFNEMAGRVLESRQSLLTINEELEQRVDARTSELRAVNMELDEKNERLAQLTDAALRFTDDVAHEFRTPLTVIQEYASIVMDGIGGPVTNQQQEYLNYIETATTELASLVDDFLDSSRVRAGTIRVDREPHNVDAILDSCWPLLKTRAAASGVTLERRVAPDLPIVRADLDKARRTLINLVVNAIKFSGAGKAIVIQCEQTVKGMVEIAVTDQGPGLAPDELAVLFERFRQCAEGQRCAAKGFGLGLSIVRDMVALNLGEVTVTSELGKGSTFSFTLPLDEHDAFISAYVAHLRRTSTHQQLSAVTADCPSAGSAAVPLSEWLTCVLPADAIQIPLIDNQRILILTPIANPSKWVQDLSHSLAAAKKRRGTEDSPHIHFATLGTFELDDVPQLVADQLDACMTKEGCTVA